MPQGFAIVHNKQILAMRPWGQLHVYAQRAQAEYILKDVHADGLPAAEIMEVDMFPKGQAPLPSWMT
jgi:hypothetical protein